MVELIATNLHKLVVLSCGKVPGTARAQVVQEASKLLAPVRFLTWFRIVIIRGAKDAIDHLIAIAEVLNRVDPKGYKSHNKTRQPTDLTQDQQKVLYCPLAYIHIDIDCQCD